MKSKNSSSAAPFDYHFKSILTADELIDFVLSKTQKRTPTVVHPQYDIRRIRSFYMRKVKFVQQMFHEKLSTITSQFPKLDTIHPFYADLLNVLYDKDHYKISLSRVNSACNFVDSIAKEYIRLLKYADSPYKCKVLKRAALGRICTCIKKLKLTFSYLQEVRSHLGRLPNINVYAKTILLAGYPNTGKSTFMNVLSNANVETADWAFTTKSLYLGHFYHDHEAWQVIDTPGVLDRPLADRNTIEMTSIVALAHLPATVLYLIDISETCGYTITEQCALLESLLPILASKPLVVILNKIDLLSPDDLTLEQQAKINRLAELHNSVKFVACSTKEQIALDNAKDVACKLLNTKRAQQRLLHGKSVNALASAYITDVTPSEDRPPTLFERKTPEESMDDGSSERLTTKLLAEKFGGDGVYVADTRKQWLLDCDDWKYDEIPHTYNGKNIIDFIDPDIERKLELLEKEEAELEASWDVETRAPTQEWYDVQKELYEARVNDEAARLLASLKRSKNHAIEPRRLIDTRSLRLRMEELGIDPNDVLARIKQIHVPQEDEEKQLQNLVDSLNVISINALKETGDLDDSIELQSKPVSKAVQKLKANKLKAFALSRRQGHVGLMAKRKLFAPDRQHRGLPSTKAKESVDKVVLKNQNLFSKPAKNMGKMQTCETDRHIAMRRPKHLFSGKRSNGKTDRR